MSEMLAKLKKDQVEARKTKNLAETTFLSTLIADVNTFATKGGERRELTDKDVVRAVTDTEKGLLETRGFEEKRDATEAVAEIDWKISVLQRYKPAPVAQMTEDELRDAIAKIRADKPDAKIGDVMAALKAEYGGRYDGKMASALAKG